MTPDRFIYSIMVAVMSFVVSSCNEDRVIKLEADLTHVETGLQLVRQELVQEKLKSKSLEESLSEAREEIGAGLVLLESSIDEGLQQNKHWEYLILSFGETQFNSATDAVSHGVSKIVTFRDTSDYFDASEALSLQHKLDLLGRLGWDVIDIVGTISGDQQVVMKRLFSQEQQDLEKKILTKLKVQLEEEKNARTELNLKQSALREKRQQELEKSREETAIVDLDLVDELDASDAIETDVKELLTDRLETTKNSISKKHNVTFLGDSISVKSTVDDQLNRSTLVTMSMKIDIAAVILKGNKYRSSEALSFIEKFEKELLEELQIQKSSSYDSSLYLTIEYYSLYKGEQHLMDSNTNTMASIRTL